MISADSRARNSSSDERHAAHAASGETKKSTSGTVTRSAIKGFGYVYLRGRTWWIRYSHRGRDNRESSSSDNLAQAQRLLKDRWKQIGRGRFVGPSEDRVRCSELFDALLVDYQNNGRRSRETLKWRLRPLREAFGLDRAIDLTETRIEQYKSERLTTKVRGDKLVAPATVNRELAALKRAFKLAVEQKRLSTMPAIKLLAENHVRQGFVEPPLFTRIATRLLEPLNDIAWFAYLSGWRKSEITTLEWGDVDREGQRVTLRRERSKTGEPRVLPLIDELVEIIDRRWRAREYTIRDGGITLSRYVFHRHGQRVVEFRKPWAEACAAAGLPGVLFHDLRRSCVRNLERSGVSQTVAMRITGHRTISVYQRYRITNEDDRREALAKMQASVRSARADNVASIGDRKEARS
jgi:integrase